MRKGTIRSGAFFLAAALWFPASRASAQAPYSQNKTINIVHGGDPGGTGDLQSRALIPFLKRHLPGDPTIIVENMPGAAGRKAANQI